MDHSPVRLAVEGDIDAIRAVGAASGELFRTVDDPRVARCADDPPIEADDLHAYIAVGRAFVVEDDGAVAGFAVVDLVDECAHLEEIAVHPDSGGRGLGSSLLDAVARWAREQGREAVTLTTFREVPWNAPFYERRGYRVLGEGEITPGLEHRVADEAAHGLDPDIRAVMRLDLT